MSDHDDFPLPDPVVDPIDMSHATPELFAALHAAQQRAQTVGKDGYNNHSRYNYATAEAMIRAGRACREGTGLALFCTSTKMDAPPPRGDAKQWVCGTVVRHWVLTHDKGGYIRGRAELDAIASGMRPNDKAIKAADTYLHGFIERDLFDLDRAEESDAVDQREDKDYRPAETQRKPAKAAKPKQQTGNRSEANKAARQAYAKYVITAQKNGHPMRTIAEFISDATGKPVAEVDANEAKWDQIPDRVWEKVCSAAIEAFALASEPAREPGEDDEEDAA